MKILAFEYRDTIRDWTLERVTFDGFDLLVGVSGAGKTRIIRALEQVCAVALGSKELEERIDLARGAEFAIEFEHDGLAYRWQAELQKPSKWPERGDGTVPVGDPPLVRAERLTQGERLLVERDEERFVLDGNELPRLDRTKSAIAILKEDTLIAPIYAAFARCIAPKTIEALPGHGTNTKSRLETWRQKYRTVDELGADFSLHLHEKAEALQELFPASFASVREAFQEAFPSVRGLWVHRVPALNAYRVYWVVSRLFAPDADRDDERIYGITMSANEEGVKGGILFHDMSSGMQRYLSFLIHLSFAPPGTVVLIDELESSLGVNCLPAVTRFLLRRAPDLQFIVTSHHPYIIEQIPPNHWKIVTRHGSHVRVLDAKTIPALVGGRSHLDRFTRLMNLPEYEQGIQGTGS